MKERLTGAIILVVLIVLLVPELLSGPSRSAPASQAAVTSSEELPLRSYTINLADDSHVASSTGNSNASPQASGPAQPTPITEQPAAAQQGSEADSPDAVPSAVGGSNPDATRGSDTARPDAARAPDVRGETPQAQPRPTPTHTPTPPPLDRSSAERATTTEKPSATGGWVVQLGVFSVQANAERLAQELKAQGFHALVSESGGGRPLWRVRSGPVAERAAAEQLNARLRAAGHTGSIVPK